MWVATEKLPRSPGHPFYERLNQVLVKAGFDAFVEKLCARFYADRLGRPSLRPGRYFQLLLVGYFEGLNSERAIAWRVSDSASLRVFLEYDPEEAPPNHSTLSRTRRRIDVETHGEVFTWVLKQLAEAGLVKGKTIGIDATTLEANAAMRSIVRRDTGKDYETFVRGLAEASGVETPTREELIRFDRKRKPKKMSNEEWMNPHDPDAKITKLKDGRTRLGHKVEEAVDLETGAVVAVTAPDELGDTQTMGETLRMAQEEVTAVEPDAEVHEVVADKGYHSNETVLELKALGLRSYLSETDRGQRNWKGNNKKYQAPVYANRRRIRGRRGRRLQRQRSELVERPFAHQFVTGGLRRIFVRQATADPCLWIQPGIADASPDGGRHASESPKPRLDAPFYGYLDPNGALDSQESPLGAFLGVVPARFAVLRSWNPSLGHLNASVRKEHKPEKSRFCHGLLPTST